MNPILIGGILDAVGKVADDLFTSDEERAQMALEGAKLDAGLRQAQMAVNEAEAKHNSLFVAGWRPAIGWIGAGSMAYQFILYPFLIWAWAVMQGAGWITTSLTPPPMLDTEALWVILSGMLGLAGFRTVEKVKNVAKVG